jgi:endonuclease YncB( thermonuclease family)
MGFDAPEIFHAQCDDERILGLRAKARLEALIASGTAQLIEHRLDKYGRTLAELTIDGKDVAQTMIDQRFARPYLCRGSRQVRPLELSAAGVLLVHNHPSDDPRHRAQISM